MGQKFPKETQERMRARADALERILVSADPGLIELTDKNSIRPLFVALADHAQKSHDGVVSMISPTIALSATSGLKERQLLAQRFYVDTVVTCHQPGNINMSQNTSINESIVVMRRHRSGFKPPTRFVHLDRVPVDESEVEDLHRCLLDCAKGKLANGWGEISHWPAERMERGDWTPAIWRSPDLAEATARFVNDSDLQPIGDLADVAVHRTDTFLASTGERIAKVTIPVTPGSVPILKSKGSEGQQTIKSTPDEWWVPKRSNEGALHPSAGTRSEDEVSLLKAAYLLVADGQRNNTARLTAVASDDKYVGVSWMPVTGLSREEAKAVAVFLNSTAGRVQIMSNAGRTLEFPMYRPASIGRVHIPDIKDDHARDILASCWERTKDIVVPQYRDGECEVRRLWDEAVADAMGWDSGELARLRNLLHNEPHVRGLGRNQYADEVDDVEPVDSPADAEEFQLVPNRSTLEPGMDDPRAMKQVLEDEDTQLHLRAQADV